MRITFTPIKINELTRVDRSRRIRFRITNTKRLLNFQSTLQADPLASYFCRATPLTAAHRTAPTRAIRHGEHHATIRGGAGPPAPLLRLPATLPRHVPGRLLRRPPRPRPPPPPGAPRLRLSLPGPAPHRPRRPRAVRVPPLARRPGRQRGAPPPRARVRRGAPRRRHHHLRRAQGPRPEPGPLRARVLPPRRRHRVPRHEARPVHVGRGPHPRARGLVHRRRPPPRRDSRGGRRVLPARGPRAGVRAFRHRLRGRGTPAILLPQRPCQGEDIMCYACEPTQSNHCTSGLLSGVNCYWAPSYPLLLYGISCKRIISKRPPVVVAVNYECTRENLYREMGLV